MAEFHLLLIVRVLHVLASTIWAGGAILIAAFIMPVARGTRAVAILLATASISMAVARYLR